MKQYNISIKLINNDFKTVGKVTKFDDDNLAVSFTEQQILELAEFVRKKEVLLKDSQYGTYLNLYCKEKKPFVKQSTDNQEEIPF